MSDNWYVQEYGIEGYTKCDGCGESVLDRDLIYVRIPRPSDRTDMCCIMWGCRECFPWSYGYAMTDREWSEWIEGDGMREGYMWLS